MNNYLLTALVIFASAMLLTLLIERMLIPLLTKRAAQPIYAEGPSWHLSKSGTPTMGGVAFLIAISLSVGLACIFLLSSSGSFATGLGLLIALIYAIGNSLIGIFDDVMKLKKNKNAGLSPMQKLILQSLLAILFLMARKFYFDDSTIIDFSFLSIDLGIFYYPFALVILLGTVNCANLTDGIDGLASSVSVIIGFVFLIIGAITSLLEIGIISSALIGGAMGFLIFNRHPAKIFMGDTGSLFLGALAVAQAFILRNPIIIILIGIVYVIEGVSVILQVFYFKLTKKRLFKMAPMHHHLEKCGFSENKICLSAVLVTLLFSLLSFAIFRYK